MQTQVRTNFEFTVTNNSGQPQNVSLFGLEKNNAANNFGLPDGVTIKSFRYGDEEFADGYTWLFEKMKDGLLAKVVDFVSDFEKITMETGNTKQLDEKFTIIDHTPTGEITYPTFKFEKVSENCSTAEVDFKVYSETYFTYSHLPNTEIKFSFTHESI